MKIFKNYLSISLLFVTLSVFIACDDEDDDEPTPATTTTSTGGGNSGGGNSNSQLNSFLTLSGEYQFSDSLITSATIATARDSSAWDVFEMNMGNSSTDYRVIFRMNPSINRTAGVNDAPPIGTFDGSQNGFGFTVIPTSNPSEIYTARSIRVTIDQSNNNIISGTIVSDSLVQFGGTKILSADLKFQTSWRSVFY